MPTSGFLKLFKLSFLGDHLYNGSPYAIGPLSVLFVTLVYCGQTFRCQCRLALDGDPAPQKGHSPLIFGRCLLWPKGWMDHDATCCRGRPRSRPHCVRWTQPSPQEKKAQSSNFRPMSVVVKRLDVSRYHLVRRYRLRPRPHCVLDGTQLPAKGGTAAPQFSAHVYCGRTVAHLSNC